MQRPTGNTWRRASSALAGAALCALALGGCALLEDGPGYDPVDVVDPSYTQDEEREIGLRFDRALHKSGQILHDPVINHFLEALGREIVARAEPQPFIYRFRVIDDPSLNAFAVFGGYVYLHAGTLLAASTVDEFAGVIGHEIAHVRMRHHARIHEKTQIPAMLSKVAGLAGAGVSGDPGALIAANGINVALQLHFSREFEVEADRQGIAYMAEAGFEPAGITRFFARILEHKSRFPDQIPPYLYSHPEIEDRISYVEAQATQLRVDETARPDLDAAMVEAQARLGQMVERGRTRHIEPREVAGDVIAPLLKAAHWAAESGQTRRALDLLRRAEQLEPNDPQVPFRRGEMLHDAGLHEAAASAFQRTLELDPHRALVFYRLGEVRVAQGDRPGAVYAFERAAVHAGTNGALERRAAWEVEKLTFDRWVHCRDDALKTPASEPAPTGDPCPGAEED